MECFVNDELALSYRVYDPTGGIPFHKFGLFAEDSTVVFHDIALNEEID